MGGAHPPKLVDKDMPMRQPSARNQRAIRAAHPANPTARANLARTLAQMLWPFLRQLEEIIQDAAVVILAAAFGTAKPRDCARI